MDVGALRVRWAPNAPARNARSPRWRAARKALASARSSPPQCQMGAGSPVAPPSRSHGGLRRTTVEPSQSALACETARPPASGLGRSRRAPGASDCRWAVRRRLWALAGPLSSLTVVLVPPGDNRPRTYEPSRLPRHQDRARHAAMTAAGHQTSSISRITAKTGKPISGFAAAIIRVVFERLTVEARSALQRGHAEGRALGATHISSGHYLLGLMGDEVGLGAKVLNEFELSPRRSGAASPGHGARRRRRPHRRCRMRRRTRCERGRVQRRRRHWE